MGEPATLQEQTAADTAAPEPIENMSAKDTQRTRHNHAGLPLMPTLMLGIGLLVLVAVGSVLLLQWVTGRAIIQEFASRLIARSLYTSELALRQHLDAAVDQANFIAASIKAGRYEFSDPALNDFIAGTIAAAPQIGGLILADRDGKALRLVRGASGTTYQLDRLDITKDQQLAKIAGETREQPASYWGEPVYRDLQKTTFLNYRVPIRKEGAYLGFLGVAISVETLSALTAEQSNPPERLSFMLYGHDGVLAHPLMADGAYGRSPETPLPTLQTFGDLVIEDLPNLSALEESGIVPPLGADAREVTIDERRYFIITREVSGYGDLPITVGGYYLASAVDAPLRLFYWATVIALAMFGGSLIVTAVIVGAISRPIRRAARGAAAIGSLDFDKVAPLSQSYFREINDLARSFNSMLDGLKAFGRYVPRTLVMRLVKEGRVGTGSEERELAVMFTDIVGFTTACEDMSAAEVADFINHHLTLVSDCIEREGGTIDKYIGDAVMAFWGAPQPLLDHAVRGCRAALAIRRAIEADNTKRRQQGMESVHVRIGLHMGPVVVGNIGSERRVNYSIIGDSVNVAARLESQGKELGDPSQEVGILASDTVLEAAGLISEAVEVGSVPLRGRTQAMRVYRL